MRRVYTLGDGPRRHRRGDTEITMTPMIDVIFLLLVFFLATSSFQPLEKLLPGGISMVSPPAASGEAAELPPEVPEEVVEQVVVQLAYDGENTRASINGMPLGQFGDLQARLTAIRQVAADVPVIIDPQDNVPMQQVVRAYDWARQAGLLRVFLATRSNE